MLARLRSLVRSRWHLVVGAAGLGALLLAGWVALTEGSVGLVGVLLVQAVGMVGLALVEARSLTIYRRVGALENRLDKTGVAQIKQAPPSSDLGRLLNGLGAERLDAALRHEDVMSVNRELLEKLGQLERRQAELAENDHVHQAFGDLAGALKTQFEGALGEEAALHNLYRVVDVDREMPSPVGFAASPRTLLRLVDICLSLPPDRFVLECGSGASTVWLAHACRRAGSGRVVALEHEEKYAQATSEVIAKNGLEAWAEVRTAPLEPIAVGEETFSWYARSTWSDLKGAHLLFVDGPPGRIGPRSRYPAFPLLAASLVDGAVVALDDAQRADERAVGRSWLDERTGGARLIDQGIVGRTWLFEVTRSG